MAGSATVTWIEVIEALQLGAAIAAVAVAPGAASALISRLRSKFTAICFPPRSSASQGKLWHVSLRHDSATFTDQQVFVIPQRQGNKIAAARVWTHNDGGLSISHLVDHGRLALSFAWFYRRRVVELSIRFEHSDVPLFYSPSGLVRRQFANAEGPNALVLEEVRYRLVLFMLVFLLATMVIMGRLLVVGL